MRKETCVHADTDRASETQDSAKASSYSLTKHQTNHQCLNRNILKNFAIIIFHTYLRCLGVRLTSIRGDPGRS